MPADGAIERNFPTNAGQRGYTRIGLTAYDLVAYRFNLSFLWRCKKEQLLGMYEDHVSGCHLDIGVATGALLDHCSFPVRAPEITLMDINPRPLAVASQRLQRYAPKIHQANVLEPWGLPPASFESVAMMDVLHCVPGTIKEKAVSFDHAHSALGSGGTLFGATVLGKGVTHTRRSAWAMQRINRRGEFNNLDDSLDDLRTALADRFSEHRVDVHGAMAFFVAKK